MAISLIDNLKIQNKKQNVERDSFATIADMVAYSPNYLPNIFHAMCEETGKMYIYDVNNDEDPDLGKWKVLQGEGGGTAEVPIEKIKVNGELQTPVNKVVDIIVPTVTNDLTDELKTAYDEAVTAKHTHENSTVLDGITAEKVAVWDKAEENVQSDWNETDETADGFIKNKPTIPSKISELDNDSNYQTADDITTTLAPYAKSEDVTNEITTEVAKIVADAPEDFNTLKEMSDWISGHENDATAMNSAIKDNKDAIIALQTDKADKSEIPTTVAELTDSGDYAKTSDVNDSISALQTDKADASDLTAHTDDADIHVTVENKTLWNTVEDKVDKVEGKGLSTNDLTDELKQKYDDAVTAKHTHENGTVLDKFSESNEGVLLFNGEKIESELALDSTPTKDSKNYVNSGVVYGSLFETKQKTIIDTPENYVSCASSDDGALEVVTDDAIPTDTQVTLSVVQAFVPTAQVGEYYQHIDEVSHLEDYEDTIYREKDDSYSSIEVDEKIKEVNDRITEIASGGLKTLSLTEYRSFMDNLVISADGYVAP